jgi:radical SAM protein with 4Fe4S-binding SPASM domain
MVEISIYGATAETFEKVSGVEGSYDRCLAGVEALLERKIELKLKTILLEQNSHEFSSMEKMAQELGVSLRLDAAVFPCLDGNRFPTTLRIPADKAVALEFNDPLREKNWREYFERTRDLPVEDTLYTCGAGLTSWHVDSRGRLLPCLLLTSPAFDLKKGPFIRGWEEVIIPFRQRKAAADYPCNRCEKRALCGYCPALFELEEGSPGHPADYVCRLGEERFLRLTGGLYKG